ncbi:MAG TPA: proliferating cell nuclear antigen (pcna) [archaeon]|nr:proliferating cell nuclear antigen (pcna) [archaeon]
MAIELKSMLPWKKAIDAISSFISEGNFHFSDSGIFFKAIDPSQVILVDFSLPKSIFDSYEIEPSLVGVDLVELSKIMNRAMPEDKLSMTLSESELFLSLEGELSRNFSLPLIDINEEEINIPEVKFDARVEINSRILKETLKDAALFGSSVVFKIKNNSLAIESVGNGGTLKTTIKQAKLASVKTNAEVTSKYSLNFLQNIVKEADLDKKILLELKSDAPMKISYAIGPSTIQFRLAHMIL